ncbi:MAG TPA: histidine phosphatase family protein [Propionibacteriaceae bacterium]|nr:histidine phosphatase family protein [Propionibacteriaceae bacterium]
MAEGENHHGDEASVRAVTPLELVLVRHGESVGNVLATAAQRNGDETIRIGERDADVPLSSLGVEQATALGGRLAEILGDADRTLVWSSPYVRAVQTADTALRAAGADLPIRLDERLRDRELGILDLLTWLGVQRLLPQEAKRRRWLGKFYHRPPGGESWADVVLRLRSFLHEALAEPHTDRIVLFSHDAVITLVRYVLEGMREADVLALATREPVLNASVTRLRRSRDGAWELKEYNDVSHLQTAGAPVTHHKGESDVRPH